MYIEFNRPLEDFQRPPKISLEIQQKSVVFSTKAQANPLESQKEIPRFSQGIPKKHHGFLRNRPRSRREFKEQPTNCPRNPQEIQRKDKRKSTRFPWTYIRCPMKFMAQIVIKKNPLDFPCVSPQILEGPHKDYSWGIPSTIVGKLIMVD